MAEIWLNLKQKKLAYLLSVLLIILVSMWVGSPMLKLRWDLVDDGISMAAARFIDEGIRSGRPELITPFIFEDRFVRFRPVFWSYFWAQYQLFGTDPWLFRLVRLSLFSGSALLLFELVRRNTKSMTAAVIAALLYLVQPHDIVNWLYLGHHEALQNIFLIWFLYAFSRHLEKPRGLGGGWLAAAMLTLPLFFWSKETSLALVPVWTIGTVAAWKWGTPRQRQSWWLTWLVAIACAGLMLIILKWVGSRADGGYVAAYDGLSIDKILFALKIYARSIKENFSILYWLPIGSYAARMLLNLYAKTKFWLEVHFRWQLLMLTLHYSFIAIVLPFTMRTEGYYLAPAFVTYLIFVGFELAVVLSRAQFWRVGLVMALFGFLIVRNTLFVQSFVSEFVTTTEVHSQVMEWVVAHTTEYPRVMFNFAEPDRGMMPGIRIQRGMIFPCSQGMPSDTTVIYGDKSTCPDQVLTHVPDRVTHLNLSGLSLVVTGDAARGESMLSLPGLYESGLGQGKQVRLVNQIQNTRVVIDRSLWLENYLQLYTRPFLSSVKQSLTTGSWDIYLPQIKTKLVQPQWQFHEITDLDN